MSFRDNRDALLSRADALEKQARELERSLEAAAAERDENKEELDRFRDKLSEVERQRDRLKRKLGESPGRPNQRKWLYILGVVVGCGIVAGYMFTVGSSEPAPPGVKLAVTRPPEPVVPRKPAAAKRKKAPPAANPLTLVRRELGPLVDCMDGVDLELRVGFVAHLAKVDPGLKKYSGYTGQQLYKFWSKTGVADVKQWLKAHPGKRQAEAISPEPSPKAAPTSAPALSPPRPAAELAPRVRSYLEALEAYLPLASRATRYYRLGNFKDDDFAEGKKLAPRLKRAHEAFVAVADPLRKAVAEHRAARNAAEVKALEALGETRRPYYRRLRLFAAQIADGVAMRDAKPSLEQAVAAYEKGVEDLEASLKLSSSRRHNWNHTWIVRMLVVAKKIYRLRRQKKEVPTRILKQYIHNYNMCRASLSRR